MKKLLLFSAAIVTAFNTVNAQDPKEYPGVGFRGFSPDGTYAVAQAYDMVDIINLTTNQTYNYAEGYALGTGNCLVSNNGVVVGSKSYYESACYWKDGEWHDIEDAQSATSSYAHDITADGSRIVGVISPASYTGGYEGLMAIPCYWDVKEDGTYGETNYLPYPETDLTGRTPQYVTAVCVSEDGTVIAGQVTDYSGTFYQPIIYTLDADGKWEYTLIQDEIFHPEGFTLPEDPGEAPETSPYFYMSDEEKAAYDAALQAWEDAGDYDFDNYPNQLDYLKGSGLAEYQKALLESEEWDEKWMAFSMALEELHELTPAFVFNNVFLSADGKLYATSSQKEKMDPMTWESTFDYAPYVFNLEDNTYTSYPSDELLLTISSLTNDGTLLAYQTGRYTGITNAYILPAGEKDFDTLYNYICSKNASLGDWMKENLTREYTAWDMETYEEYTAEALSTGMAFTNRENTIFGLTVENFWYDWESADDEDAEPYYPVYGYLFTRTWAGVAAPVVGTVSVKALPGAVLSFTGDVASVSVYTISGVNVFKAANPGATVSTGLGAGVYVVKAIAADGSATLAKVAF